MIYKKKNYFTIPNILSILRIILSPFVFLFIIYKGSSIWFLMPIFLIILLLTDLLDGIIARKQGVDSTFGSILDAFADKFFTLMMIFALILRHGFPNIILYFILIRDLLIIASSIYIYKAKKKKYLFQNIWEKISTILLVLLVTFVSLETLIPHITELSLFLILIIDVIIVCSLIHFLARFVNIVFKGKPFGLGIITPIVVIIISLIFIFNWFYTNYLVVPKAPEFYNEKSKEITFNVKSTPSNNFWMMEIPERIDIKTFEANILPKMNNDEREVLLDCYFKENIEGNYLLRENIDDDDKTKLIDILDSIDYNPISNNPFLLGPALGKVTPTSIVVWILTREEKTYNVVVYEDKYRTRKAINKPFVIKTQNDDDLTELNNPEVIYYGWVEVTGLTPNTEYYYDIEEVIYTIGFSILDDGIRDYCKFKTFPEDDTDFEKMRFMVTSCHRPLDKNSPDYYRSNIVLKQFKMWEALLRQSKKEPFDFLLQLGDQVYSDAQYEDTFPSKEEFNRILTDENFRRLKEHQVRNEYRKNYIRYWNQPSIRKVMASIPSFMMWDDHDFRDGWGSYPEDTKDPIVLFMRDQSIKVYEEFQNVFNPKPHSEDKTSWHYYFDYGKIGFFIPDLRYHRDLNKPISKKPLMGEKQWQDFDKWITGKALDKSVIFLGSSVPFVDAPNWIIDWLSFNIDGLEDDMRDRLYYEKNRPEMIQILDRLFEYQEKTDSKAYTFGGDIHVNLMSRIINRNSTSKDPNDSIIYEFSSSGIGNEDPDAQLFYAIFKVIFGNNDISSKYYSQELKIRNVMTYGVIEISKIVNGKYDVKYYVAYEVGNTPDSVGYQLFYQSNTIAPFPEKDIELKTFPE